MMRCPLLIYGNQHHHHHKIEKNMLFLMNHICENGSKDKILYKKDAFT